MGGGAAAWLWSRAEPDGNESVLAPPAIPELPSSRAPSEWELETVRVVVANKLAEADLPAPPGDCSSENGIGAGTLILSAREKLESDPAAALDATYQALDRCPTWATAHNVRGNALQSLGRLDEAVAAYTEALQLAPLYDAPRFNLGVVQLRRKDPTAIATFTALIEQKPSYPDVYASRAQAYLFAERYREGLADLEEAVKQDANAGTVWLMLGQLRERLKRPQANEAYCKASELGVAGAAEHCKR
jgi:tetratricopeptide (TPR) repeat protein